MGNNRFVPTMKFGVLSDMVGIKDKTLNKLSKQQVKESFQLFTLFCFLLLHILSESFFLCSEFVSDQASIFLQGNGECVCGT